MNRSRAVLFLDHSTDAISDDRVLMIIRNMAGYDMFAAVKKTATFRVVERYVLLKLKLTPSFIFDVIYLIVNYKKPIGTQQVLEWIPSLEMTGHVVDLLIDSVPSERLPEGDTFCCPVCYEYVYIQKCLYWSEDPSISCRGCTLVTDRISRECHVCCEPDEKEEDSSDEIKQYYRKYYSGPAYPAYSYE